MKIYSWNVLRSNRNVPKLCDFIRNLDFDLLCLQEVTEEMLIDLKKMPFNIAYHVDRFSEILHLFSKSEKVVNYAVILTKYKITTKGKLKFPKLLRSFNSNTFEFFMELVQKWESITNLGAVYVDLEMQGRTIRVFSVHLALWNPKTRANEFEHLMKYLPEKDVATIICGDFNILEYGPLKILNWFLSGSIYEGMPWYPERALFEKRFKENGLQNPLYKHITHKFSRSQLDHILLSKDLEVKRAWVEEDSHGSDHQLIGVEAFFKD